jgi:phosphoribosylformimino-5-aminoimidazole carboxamide ribotide isomerase
MRILPVIDLMDGTVVHAVSGRRHEYRPIVTPLCVGSSPLALARAFREHFGLAELYLADLDAIAGRPPARRTFAELIDDGFTLWVDGGVRTLHEARVPGEMGAGIVVGLETLAGPEALAEILAGYGERVMLSLDLREGEPLGRREGWKQPDAHGIAAEAVGLGVQRVLALDLARVGVGAGLGTEELCAGLASAHPHVEILAGGGVRDRADLLRLKACGVSAVLVASALHQGRLTRADIEGLATRRGED